MSYQDIYDDRKKNFTIKMVEYKKNIDESNIVNKIQATIAELYQKREYELLTYCKDPSYQHRYRGAVLSTNGHIESDFYKSIEYETLLLSALEIIEKQNKKKEQKQHKKWFVV